MRWKPNLCSKSNYWMMLQCRNQAYFLRNKTTFYGPQIVSIDPRHPTYDPELMEVRGSSDDDSAEEEAKKTKEDLKKHEEQKTDDSSSSSSEEEKKTEEMKEDKKDAQDSKKVVETSESSSSEEEDSEEEKLCKVEALEKKEAETSSSEEEAPRKVRGPQKHEEPKKAEIVRPSAAAAGFSTEGMTDAEVLKAVKTGKGNPRKKQPATKRKYEEKEEKKVIEKGVESENTSDISISETSDSESEEKEAGQFGITIRPQFPKSNIRRWMSPGARFDVPPNLPSPEDLNTRKPHFKQLELTFGSCQLSSVEDVKAKEEKPKDTKKGGKSPEELPIPTHRRRTKSWRYLSIYIDYHRSKIEV